MYEENESLSVWQLLVDTVSRLMYIKTLPYTVLHIPRGVITEPKQNPHNTLMQNTKSAWERYQLTLWTALIEELASLALAIV